MEVHDRQGINGTSVRDIATQAGVAPATVLHHFPRMGDLIQACGELADALAPMPSEGLLDAVTGRAERIHAMTSALFAWWERLGPGWDHLQVDRRVIPQVDAWLREVAERHRRLVAAAIGGADIGQVEVVTALTTHGVWRSLRDSGLDTSRAAAQVARLINSSLGGSPPPGRSRQRVH